MAGLAPHIRDRIMSLHRRAYEVIVTGGSEADWIALAKRLDFTDLDAVTQFWSTAKTAREAGMTKEFAFPLTGDQHE